MICARMGAGATPATLYGAWQHFGFRTGNLPHRLNPLARLHPCRRFATAPNGGTKLAENKRSILRLLCGERACPCGDYLRVYPQNLRRIVVYIHELSDWPHFQWDHEDLSATVAAVRHRQGRLIGRMEGLGFRVRGGGGV